MKILAVTNMYPTDDAPYYGVFVRNTCEAIRRADPSIALDVLFVDGRKNKGAYLAAPVRIAARAPRGYDLIHVHYGLLAGAGMCFPRPRLITFYGSDVNEPRERRWSRPFLRFYDGITVVSRAMRDIVGRPDAVVIPIGIDRDVFRPRSRLEARARLGLDPHARYVMFPSTPERREKRYDVFTAAVARAATVRSNIKTVLLGVPPRPNAEMPWLYAACDALMLTSDNEGSPLAIKEALAMNVPIVSVDVGDVREVLAGWPYARVVPTQSPELLASALIELLDGESATGGHERAATLSIDATARATIDVYRRLLGQRDATP